MRTNPDVVNSISENLKDISSGWLFCDVDIYDPDYKEILVQPVSIESVTINYLRFKENVSNLIIRSSTDSNSPIIWAGTSFNLPDTEEDSWVNSSAIQFSTGVVDPLPPDAIYGTGTITIAESNVNLYDNPNFQGEIKTYLVTSATFTLTDGTQQYLVADHNNGSPIYRLESIKSNINNSNIALIRIVWRAGNNVHSSDLDSAGVGLGNKINDSIINTTPYRKSVEGGLTLSETSTPIARTVLITEAEVYTGATPHPIEAFNSSINLFTSVTQSGSGNWSYSSATTYPNNFYNPVGGLSALDNNKYAVVWIYRSIGDVIETFYTLGSEQYNNVETAKLSTPIQNIPVLLRGHCLLVGRIIVQKGASSGVVENVQDVSFSGSAVSVHNDLGGLQGGDVGEYYHLSGTDYTKLTTNFNPTVRSLFTGTSPINYTSATGTISHATIGTAGTYTKVVTNATGHITSGGVLVSSDIPNLSTTYITTTQKGVANGVATLDSNAKVPLSQLPATTIVDTFVVASSAAQLALSAANQGDVCIRTDVNKTYILKTDPYSVWGNWQEMLTPTDSVTSIFGRIGVITSLSADYASFYAPIVHTHSQYLTSSSSLNPANVTQTSAFRFVTDTEKATWNGKQNAITLGTTAQYFRGDLSLATFPTNLSSFTNGPGYVTSAIGDLRYAPFSHTQAWSTITSVPVASTSTSGVLTSTDWNTFNNKASTAQLANYLPLSGGTLTGNLFGTTASFGNASLASYTPNGNYAWFGKNGENPTVGTNLAGMITGDGETYIGARSGKMVRLDVSGVDVVTIGGSLVSVYQPTLFSSSVTLANNTWNAIGDDFQFGDMNVGNTVGFRGVPNTNTGYIRFGTTSVASTGTLLNDFGWDGSKFTIGTNTVWHSGNLTNLNQLSNGPGYLTASTGKAQFSLPPTASVITWFKIGTIGTVSAVGSGHANLMLDSYANYNYGGNQAPWESIRFASRGSIFLEVRSMLGVGVNTYGYTTNGAVLELWVRTNSTYTPTIMYQVNSSQGVGVSYGLLFQTGTEPSGITYVTTKTIYDDRYLQLTGGTLTGNLSMDVGKQLFATRSMGLSGTSYSNAAIRIDRNDSAGTSTHAGMGFLNNNANAAFLYYDAQGTGFRYRTDLNVDRQIWDSSNLTNLNQLSNGPGYVTSAIGDLRYQPLENQRLSTTNEVVFSGLRLAFYPGSTAYSGIWASGLTKGNNNWSFLISSAGSTEINSSNVINLQTTNAGTRASRVSIGHTLTTFLTPISGTNASFSGAVSAGTTIIKSSSSGHGAFVGCQDTGTLATTEGIIFSDAGDQNIYCQRAGGKHSFYVDGTNSVTITDTELSTIRLNSDKISNQDIILIGSGTTTLSSPSAGRIRMIHSDIMDSPEARVTYNNSGISIIVRAWFGMYTGATEGELTTLSGGNSYRVSGSSGSYAPRAFVEYSISSTKVMWLS